MYSAGDSKVGICIHSTLQNELIQSRLPHFTEQQQQLATYKYLVAVHLLHAKKPQLYAYRLVSVRYAV